MYTCPTLTLEENGNVFIANLYTSSLTQVAIIVVKVECIVITYRSNKVSKQ